MTTLHKFLSTRRCPAQLSGALAHLTGFLLVLAAAAVPIRAGEETGEDTKDANRSRPVPVAIELDGGTGFDFLPPLPPSPESSGDDALSVPGVTVTEVGGEGAEPLGPQPGRTVLTAPRNITRKYSLRDLLGTPIEKATVVHVDQDMMGYIPFDDGRDLLREVLYAVMLSPRRQFPPQPYPPWAEFARPAIEARLDYADGSVGRLATNGRHVRIEDPAGLSWYYRWAHDDPNRPGSQREAPR